MNLFQLLRPGLCLALFAFLLPPLSVADTYAPFKPDLPAGAAYQIDAHLLHPTQFAVGMREIVFKIKILNQKSPAEIRSFLEEKNVPVVIGPGGVPYMTDGHHTIRALLESASPQKIVYGHILANWSAESEGNFWALMQAKKFTYLKDHNGVAREPDALPSSLLAMANDPYRSLGWAVIYAGGFESKTGPAVFFQEFYWGDYFRPLVKWDDTNDAEFNEAVKAAVILARQPAAAHLPGYHPGK